MTLPLCARHTLVAVLALFAGLHAFCVGARADAAVVTLSGEATFAAAESISSLAFALTLDTAAATPRAQGGFLLSGVTGQVAFGGTTFSVADARVIATQRANGRNVLVLRLGDVGGQQNLRLTLTGPQDGSGPMTDLLAAVLTATGYDALRVQADGPAALRQDSLTASFSVPLPGGAVFLATGLAALAAGRRRAPA